MRQTGEICSYPNAPQPKNLLGLEALTASAVHSGTVPSKSTFDIVLWARSRAEILSENALLALHTAMILALEV
jgi:hypothetical protein